MEFVNLKQRLDEPIVYSFFSNFAVGFANIEKVQRVLKSYRLPAWNLFGVENEGSIIGILGYETVNYGMVVIQHIAVAPTFRRRGLGRQMVAWLHDSADIHTIEAETDEDALDFYRKCGFRIEMAVNKRFDDGGVVRRYVCIKHRSW